MYWPDQEEELVVTYVQEQTKSASLYAAEKLKTRDKYGMFLNGNHPLTEIRTMASTGRKLLLIKDSYANCFVPFLTGDLDVYKRQSQNRFTCSPSLCSSMY